MSLEDVDLESLLDKDDLIGDFNEVFSSPYYLAHSTLSLNKAYVLNVDLNCDGTKYCASFSNRHVNVYTESLTTLCKLEPHEKSITQTSFSKTDPQLLFTSSSDCTIKLWDLRCSEKASREFKDTSDHTKHEGPPRNPEKPILCFDTSRDSRVVCAGTEQVGQDAYLLFWDMRAGPLMGGYWESHEDDITCIKFHPEKNDSMASGSTDGLVNVFDLNEGKEDDALLTCHNTEDSVSSLHWFSKKNNLRYLGIATHTESIQLWDTDDYQPYQTIARSDVCHSIRRTVPEHSYIVGMHDQEEQGFLVLAGSRYSLDPCLRLTTLKNKKLKPCGDLKDGKVGGGIVRCSAQLPSYSGFITGSEGGVVAVWRTGDQPAVQQITETFKIKNKISKRDNPY